MSFWQPPPPVGQWRRHREALLDLLLPVDCVACGWPGRVLCARCRTSLTRTPVTLTDLPVMDPPAGVAAGPYGGPAREAILALKERGRRALARDLGEALAVSIASVVIEGSGGAGPLVVPIPPSPGSVRRRGEDVLGLIVSAAVRELQAKGSPVGRPRRRVLRAARSWQDQADLGAMARRANLAGALVARAPRGSEADAPVIVVDDVVTTGATAVEAIRALRAAGWRVHGVAAVCATPRRRATLPPRAGLED